MIKQLSKAELRAIPMVSLEDLRAAGVEVTVCKPARAKGVPKRMMRVKGSGGYVVGGDRPGSVKAATMGS